jgi:hypothetical protein
LQDYGEILGTGRCSVEAIAEHVLGLGVGACEFGIRFVLSRPSRFLMIGPDASAELVGDAPFRHAHVSFSLRSGEWHSNFSHRTHLAWETSRGLSLRNANTSAATLAATSSMEPSQSTERVTAARGVAEIAPGDISGGPNTSHTIMVGALRALLDAVPRDAGFNDYKQAALESNVLGKQTDGARRRTFRYLRELYLLRPDALLFRALRQLCLHDRQAQPLLAGLCAVARDAVFRASSDVITQSHPGDALTAQDFARVVGNRFPGVYRDTTMAKIGRNVFSSWEQTGHLARQARLTKVRTRVACQPADVAYALMLGYLEGARGEALFMTLWAKVLDQPMSHLYDLASSASQRGLMEFRHAGGVVEVSFHELLRPFDGEHA